MGKKVDPGAAGSHLGTVKSNIPENEPVLEGRAKRCCANHVQSSIQS